MSKAVWILPGLAGSLLDAISRYYGQPELGYIEDSTIVYRMSAGGFRQPRAHNQGMHGLKVGPKGRYSSLDVN